MSILSVYESESYVEGLQPIPLDQVGSKLWLHQSEHLQRLNQQAHLDALTHHDEYIVDCILLHNRLPTLIHHLLTLEAYAHHVTPHILPRLTPPAPPTQPTSPTLSTSLRLYLLLYQQPVACNLLECLLYRPALLVHGGEALVELVDYCVRKVRRLGEWVGVVRDGDGDGEGEGESEEGDEARMRRQMRQMEFACAACCLVILRYITDRLADLPLALVNRLIHTHDLLLTIIPILHANPFTRHRTIRPTSRPGQPGPPQRVTEKYVEQQWTVVAAADLTLMTKLEGQLWLLVYNLLLSPSVRSAYSYNTHRQQAVLSLRPLLTPTVMEQLTVLEGVRRCVEELTIMTPPEPSSRDTMAVVEQLPEIRTSILRNQDFKAIADAFISQSTAPSTTAGLHSLADSLLATAALSSGPPACAVCGCEADKRCSLCAEVWYCGRDCQAAGWRAGHKAACGERVAERRRKEDERRRRDDEVRAERERERLDEEAATESSSRRWGKTGSGGGASSGGIQRVLIEQLDA